MSGNRNADISAIVYKPTVYGFKVARAPGLTFMLLFIACYLLFVFCALIKPLNTYIVVPLACIPVSWITLAFLSNTEPHFDTLIITAPRKNIIKWNLRLLGKRQKKAVILYPS